MTGVELRQFGEMDFDDLLVNGRRVGFVPHCAKAVVRFVRLLSVGEQESVRNRVAEIRAEQGRPPIAERTMQPPDPKDMLRAESMDRKRGKR